MAFSYKYADGAVHRVSAQVVGEICERIEAETGRCTAEDLLNSARDPESPLYKEFEWDDTVAAEKYRIWQSAQLIRHIRIVQSDDAKERQEYRERAFVSAPGQKGAYVSMDTALHREEIPETPIGAGKAGSEMLHRQVSADCGAGRGDC